MHRYLRSIGFSNISTREELQDLINRVVEGTILSSDAKKQKGKKNPYMSSVDICEDNNDRVFVELCLDFVNGAGVCVRGELDEKDRFLYRYYFPYLSGENISSNEDITVERHAEKESYAGVCDDIKVGALLIFYLQNMVAYKKVDVMDKFPVQGTSLILSGLSVNGMIMMPIIKNEREKKRIKKASNERNRLIAQARRGDEDAIESLTLDDMDTYSMISRKIQKEDIFSLVDTYFMPYGVECDQYSILGEIVQVRTEKNFVSDEEVVIMTVECNELLIEVCINKLDLYGEPAVGRRFKGVIWLQGNINFPSEI